MNEENSIVTCLSSPEAYHHHPQQVTVVETHISWVFLAGELVYKLKKPVDFGFLDFSTLPLRERYCHEEIRLNRRLCPDIYLGVQPVIKKSAGDYVVGGSGSPVDFVVEMRRLPDENRMDRRMARGEVTPGMIKNLAEILTQFYRNADTGGPIDEGGRPDRIKHLTDEDFWQTAHFVGKALSGTRFDHIRQYTDRFLVKEEELLTRRINEGFIRDGHGDLHMENICLGEKAWIFDCIEFNEKLRWADVASDLAFLVMDLEFHRRPDLARLLLQTYVRLSGDVQAEKVINFYKCYRSYVRGKVSCFTYEQPDAPGERREEALERARRYFDLAYTYAGGKQRPKVVVFFGLMGSGKTTWARVAAERLGAPLISSDRIRKQQAGFGSSTRVYVPYGRGIYSAETTDEVYRSMLDSAGKLAGAGLDVVMDASYARTKYRYQVRDMAVRIGAEVLFVHTLADKMETVRRLEAREAQGVSLSDGRRELLDSQIHDFEPIGDLSPAMIVDLDCNGSREETAENLYRILENRFT